MLLVEDDGFDNTTINKLLHKHKSKQNTISALENQKGDPSNKWISLTFTGNETAKLAKLFKQIDKNINVGLKTSNKIINIIGNNIRKPKKFEERRVQINMQ